jgi:hypothetical protein
MVIPKQYTDYHYSITIPLVDHKMFHHCHLKAESYLHHHQDLHLEFFEHNLLNSANDF